MDRRRILQGCLALTALGPELASAEGPKLIGAAGPIDPIWTTPLTGFALADCDGIDALDRRLAAEAARSLTMPTAETDAEVRTILAALKRKSEVAAKTQQALSSARIDLALEAGVTLLEVVLAACIAQQNTTCIASAHGAKLIYSTAQFGAQLYRAKSGTDAKTALVLLGASRIEILYDLTRDLKPRLIHEAAKDAVEKTVKAYQKLHEAGATVEKARSELAGAVSSLEAMDRNYASALTNEANYRSFRQQHFNSQRWFLGVLRSNYGSTDCEVRLRLP